MIYKLFYILMLIGYLGLSLQTPDIKGKLIGILLLIVNALIFWR
jgi:hypothetical protein